MRRTLEERFWEKVDRRGPDECWEWKGATMRTGYGQVLADDGRVHLAHRVSWKLAHGAFPDGCACHSCDNRGCVNPAHLWVGSQAENLQDMVRKGRSGRSLTDDGVREVRRLLAEGWRGVDIARHLGVSHPLVSAIKVGRARRWVT